MSDEHAAGKATHPLLLQQNVEVSLHLRGGVCGLLCSLLDCCNLRSCLGKGATRWAHGWVQVEGLLAQLCCRVTHQPVLLPKQP